MFLLVTTLLALSAVPFPQMRAAASCAAPYLDLAERPTFERGATVTVEGRAFTDGGCQDSASCEVGCGADTCEYDDPPPTPMEGVELKLEQDGQTWRLDIADAGTAKDDRLGWVSWSFEVPSEARPGPAKLLADNVEPVRIRVR